MARVRDNSFITNDKSKSRKNCLDDNLDEKFSDECAKPEMENGNVMLPQVLADFCEKRTIGTEPVEVPPAIVSRPVIDITTSEKRKRLRIFYTPSQVQRLQEEYKFGNCFIKKFQRARLAAELNISKEQIKFWFQNKRRRDRRKNRNLELNQNKNLEEEKAASTPNNAPFWHPWSNFHQPRSGPGYPFNIKPGNSPMLPTYISHSGSPWPFFQQPQIDDSSNGNPHFRNGNKIYKHCQTQRAVDNGNFENSAQVYKHTQSSYSTSRGVCLWKL